MIINSTPVAVRATANKKLLGTPDAVKKLRSEHTLYSLYAPLWRFFLSAYEGGPGFAVKENLFQHTRETDEDYLDRLKRLHNTNYCESLVDYFTAFIFSEPIERDGGADKFFVEFTSNVDRRGSDIDEFMREVSDEVQVFGMTYVLVDAPQTPDVATFTKADEEELQFRPYWVRMQPLEITDWIVDDFGAYTYMKRRQYLERFIAGEKRKIERYTEWTPYEIRVSEVDTTSEGKPSLLGAPTLTPNALGKIPVEVVYYKRSKVHPKIGLSFLRDFAYNQREVMNLTSLLQEFLYRQAFNILVKEQDDNYPQVDAGGGEQTIGTANVVEVPKDSKFPEYITPSSDPAVAISDERTRTKNEMFVRAAQDFMQELSNGGQSSGFSQAQSFSKTAPHIATRAERLEDLENALYKLTYQYIDEEWAGKVKYKDRYEVTGLTDALSHLRVLVKDFQLPSATFVKTELKRMVREYDGKLPAQELKQIEREIDEMEFDEWQDSITSSKGASAIEQQGTKQTGTMAEVVAESIKPATGATKKLKQDKVQA